MIHPDNYTIKELKEILMKKHEQNSLTEKTISCLKQDSRKGVKKLAKKYKKIIQRKCELVQRWKKRNFRQEMLHSRGFKNIVGIDEAGRGPLAGPVVAAAVVLPENCKIIHLDDSKNISEEKREQLFDIIKQEAIGIGTGIISSQIIDEINIHNAALQAMKKALNSLACNPEILLIDGNHKIPDIDCIQETIIDGDSKVNVISAASIIAKVARDKIIENFHTTYPEYNFKSNKGYGTAEHISALKKYGPTPLHRFSYKSVKQAKKIGQK